CPLCRTHAQEVFVGDHERSKVQGLVFTRGHPVGINRDEFANRGNKQFLGDFRKGEPSRRCIESMCVLFRPERHDCTAVMSVDYASIGIVTYVSSSGSPKPTSSVPTMETMWSVKWLPKPVFVTIASRSAGARRSASVTLNVMLVIVCLLTNVDDAHGAGTTGG